MMETFLKNGEPKISVSTILTNERKPRPMNSGEPHLARSPVSVRQVGNFWRRALTAAGAGR